MRAEIVSIGTELLMGETVDTNSTYLATELAKLGIDLRWVTKVGDDPGRLFEALDRAWTRSDVTLTSGGLGPTSDDLTREAIAQVFGEEMTVQDELLKHLRGLFAGRGTPMPETNVKQATLIPSAEAISNPIGTAPGWWAEKNGHVIVAMPGPPREIQRMWSYEVAPRLKAMNPGVAIVTRTLKTFGISEGALDELLTPLFKSENPLLGIYSKQDGIHLRAIATAPTEDEARRLIRPMESEIRRIVDEDAIWGEDDDTPESMTAALLGQRGLTLGIMESFTGGLLSSNLAEIEGSPGFLKGSAVVYRDELLEGHGVAPGLIQEFGPVHERVAEDMARAARRLFDADVGLAITGMANTPGPDSQGQRDGLAMGTSWVGFATRDGVGSTPGQLSLKQAENSQQGRHARPVGSDSLLERLVGISSKSGGFEVA